MPAGKTKRTGEKKANARLMEFSAEAKEMEKSMTKIELYAGRKIAAANMRNSHTIDTEPGDNRKYLLNAIQLFNLPKIDIKDPDAVQQRLTEYFEIESEQDMKPTVNGLALAFGMDRSQLQSWVTGRPFNASGSVVHGCDESDAIIRQAYNMLGTMWEDYMVNGKVNPANGIFLGKNHFDYKDVVQHVVSPAAEKVENMEEDALKSKYLDSADVVDSEGEVK